MKATVLLLIFLVLPKLYSQTDSLDIELNKIAQESNEKNSLIFKASSSFIFGESQIISNSGLGYEFELSERFSAAGLLAMVHQTPYFKEDYLMHGLTLKQQMRIYFFRCRFYVGLQAGYNHYTIKENFSIYIKGSAGGGGGNLYYKDAYIKTSSWDGYFLTGFQPRIKSTRFLIDVFGGVGFALSNLSYSGFNSNELYLYRSGYAKSDYRYKEPGKFTQFPSFFAGLSVGYRFGVKKN